MSDTTLHILVGVDFSESSPMAVAHAVKLAERTQGRLHIAHIAPANGVDAPVNLGLNIPDDFPEAKDARLRLEHVRATLGTKLDTELHVRIGEGCRIGPHSVIEGHTTLGRNNRIGQANSIGSPPQDKKYAGEPTLLTIGDGNTIREFCTINTGTVQDAGVTRVGDDNWIMSYVHIAHDCQVGSHTTMANLTQLAGHVHLGDWVTVGGLTGIHQFVKIGAHVMVGFGSAVSQDVPPYMLVDGNPLAVRGLNLEGLRRRGFSAERVAALKQAYRLLYRQGLTLEAALSESAQR